MLNFFLADYFSDYLKLNSLVEFFEFKLHFISKIAAAERSRFQYDWYKFCFNCFSKNNIAISQFIIFIIFILYYIFLALVNEERKNLYILEVRIFKDFCRNLLES